MLTVEQVLQIIRDTVQPLTPFPGTLDRPCVLAQDVRLEEDSPPFDRSQLDGFAVRSADALPGAALALLGQIDAGGQPFSDLLTPGTCTGINTGGLLPPGADAILMVEHAQRIQRDGKDFVLVNKPVKPGQGIQRRGADAMAGDVILNAGTRLHAVQRALCAAAGVSKPLIRSPRVAVLSTGDELLPINTPSPLPPGMIRNSNQVMLTALAREAHASVNDLGDCPDEAPILREILQSALAASDLLVICGGMSMGTRDLVPPLLKDLGVLLHVEKVRIKPGKPFILGTLDTPKGRRYVAGLPGNPVSAFVTFQRFVREMLRRMEASTETPAHIRARIDRPLSENGDREFYQPCRLHSTAEGTQAEILTWKGSADLFTLARANGLIIQATGAPATPAGADVSVFTW